MMTDDKRSTFEAAARPLIEWLAKNVHPHTSVIVDSNSAELVEGLHSLKTNDYLQD